MASSLQLMHFDPAAAFRNDLAAGIQARLVFYRAIAVNATDDDGLTMLAHAARVGDAEAVKILLERGADPNAKDRNGLTPLMWLAKGPNNWQENPDAVECTAIALLSAGANPNTRDSSGRTAAFFAVDQILYPFFKALAACKVRATERLDSTGFTLLHALCDALQRFAGLPIKKAMQSESDALPIAMLLVENLGVDPKARSAIGKTAREIAVANKSHLVAPWLVYGAEAFDDNDDSSKLKLISGGATACEAASMRDVGKIQALIALGEAQDEPATDGDQIGLTPLSCAASVMAVDVMTLLLDAGADPTARINGKARGGRDTEGTSAMRMLLWAPQSATSIPSNLTADDWAKALETMLRTESAANAPVDAEGLTPLLTLAQSIGRGWRAGEANWAELATGILLKKGADPNARMSAKGIDLPFCKVPGSITALGLLAMNGSQDAESVAQLLLQGGADPNLADKSGTTPLMTAAGLSSPSQAESFTELLLNAGANVALKDEKARTALDIASAAGNDGVVEKLLMAIEKTEAAAEPDSPAKAQTADEEQLTSSDNVSVKMDNDSFSNDSGTSDRPNSTPNSASFFDRIRKKHPSVIVETVGVADDDASSHKEQQTPLRAESTSSSFFDRMRSQAAARQASGQAAKITEPSPACSTLNPSDPFGPVRGMVDFLTCTLSPLKRGKIELQMMALGLFAEGGSQDADVLARRTADLLISLDMATEVDWKSEGEDFCALLEGLINFAPIREAGFDSIPLDIQPDDDVPAFANKFDAVSHQWGWPIQLAALELNADSYIFLLLDSLKLAPARHAAQRAGLSLLTPSELN